MSKDSPVSLGDHFTDFIEQQLNGGRYGSATDVIRAGLRLLEEQEVRLASLRAALVEGEASGPSLAFDIDEFVRRKQRKPASVE